MAHCGSCKSNLGTGGLYNAQGAVMRAGRATGTGLSAWTTTHGELIRSNGRINKQAWVPATSSDNGSNGLTIWAYFPGGRKANLRIDGTTQTRYVLAHKNGGPTGLLVRLGEIARDLGTGGCGDLTGLPGTGGVRVGRRRGTGKAVAKNRWFKASYFDRPASNPASWVKITGGVPGSAELWMHNEGPVHSHDVEVIQVKGSNTSLQALVAGWSLPSMIGVTAQTGGKYPRGTAGALVPTGPKYMTLEGPMK